MASGLGYSQGGDAQAIQRVASAYYGSYANMFEAHGWPERGNKIMPSVQTRVVETYGTVRAFEIAHQRGDLMFPMEAIYRKTPNVWLTSFYGFRPHEWGFLGFADEGRRQSFIKDTEPGVLVVIYGAEKAAKEDRGLIIGIQQCSHEIGNAQQFMAPDAWKAKEADPARTGKWNFGVKATKAWRVTSETRMPVSVFAPKATSTGAWQHIGARGVRLSPAEALNILKLGLEEVPVYGGNSIIESIPGTSRSLLAPSKAGPVSQEAFITKESEGPKHLYLLILNGNADAFLGEETAGRIVVKAGFSGNPQNRCDDHNRALPRCAFRWSVLHSGPHSGYEAYPSSSHAKAGEKAMHEILCRSPAGRSLGGEFFLAEPKLVKEAWDAGNSAAKKFTK